jgi:uncharacterized protein (UPF0248 family)
MGALVIVMQVDLVDLVEVLLADLQHQEVPLHRVVKEM